MFLVINSMIKKIFLNSWDKEPVFNSKTTLTEWGWGLFEYLGGNFSLFLLKFGTKEVGWHCTFMTLPVSFLIRVVNSSHRFTLAAISRMLYTYYTNTYLVNIFYYISRPVGRYLILRRGGVNGCNSIHVLLVVKALSNRQRDIII